MRTGNPTLGDMVFQKYQGQGKEDPMTLQGTVNKTLLSLLVLVAVAAFVWTNVETLTPYLGIAVIGSIIITLVLVLIIVFKKHLAPKLTLPYAALEGIVLGTISIYAEQVFPGIVLQAVGLTLAIFLSILIIYKFRIIKATKNFALGLAAATMGIFLLYIVNFAMSFFGSGISIISAPTTAGIIFSVVVVIIAALNLVLDFDFIEKGATYQAPKYLEWYATFGLLVTLVWLYIEVLRLLMKMMSRN